MLMLCIITIKDFVDQKQFIMKLNCCKVRRRFLFLASNWLYSFRVTIVRHSQYLSIKSDSDDEVVLSIEADFLREFSEIFFPWPGIFFVIFSSFFRFQTLFSDRYGRVVKMCQPHLLKLSWWYFCYLSVGIAQQHSKFPLSKFNYC